MTEQGECGPGTLVIPDPETYRWLLQVAHAEHAGDVGAAAAAVLCHARLQAETIEAGLERVRRNVDPQTLGSEPWRHLEQLLQPRRARHMVPPVIPPLGEEAPRLSQLSGPTPEPDR